MIPKYSLSEILSQNLNSLPYPPSKNLSKEFQCIYKPNDDSYMLLHTITTDIKNFTNKNKKIVTFCELGIGSGFVINNLMSFLKKKKERYNFYGIDININACNFVRDFAKFHKNEIEIINTKNFENLNFLKKKIDVLILNPVF